MFRNFEGYPDPTAGQALANIAKEERKAAAARRRAAESVSTTNDRGKSRKGRKQWSKTGVMRW